MTILEFNPTSNSHLLMFHASCMTWEFLKKSIDILAATHHVIVPVMPGYNMDDDSDYTSVEEIAKERGESFSAGQKQLIAFARIFAHNPDIFILDEATANIDTYTENLIQKSINRLSAEKTAIFIAHRLSTIVNVDKINLVPFKNIGNIISYGFNKNADFYIDNIYYNGKIFVCNINHNEIIKELYCSIYNKEDIYYIISIIILLLNEQYHYEDIKAAIQKVGH